MIVTWIMIRDRSLRYGNDETTQPALAWLGVGELGKMKCRTLVRG